MSGLAPWPFLLAVAGAGVMLWRRSPGIENRTTRRYRNAILVGLAAVAMAGYLGFGDNPITGSVHRHEWVHYYLGSKYAQELSYDRLYECLSVADLQDGHIDRGDVRVITDLRTNRLVKVDTILANPATCTDHFSTQRWLAFRHDVSYFRNLVDDRGWGSILVDHGYNATPVWTVAGTLLTNAAPASDTQVFLLSLLDPLYLLAILLAISWAFGWRSLSVAVIVLSTYLPAEYLWTGRAFLRWDWLFYLVLAICLLKKDRPYLAGIALGYATLLRVFPAVLFGAAMLIAALGLVRFRRLDRTWSRFLLGGVTATIVLVPVSFVVLGGIETFHAFAANLIKTAETPFTNAIGLRSVLSWRPGEGIADLHDPQSVEPISAWLEARNEAANETVALRALVAAAFVVLFVLAAGQARPWVVITLATTILPAVTDLLCYYYMLIVATALVPHDSDKDAAWLLGLCAVSQCIGLAPIPGMPTSIDQQYVLISATTLVTFAAILIRRARTRSVAFIDATAAHHQPQR